MHSHRNRDTLPARAKRRGAQLAVLPEYLSLELAAMFEPATRGDLHASLAAIQPPTRVWLALFADLARELDLHINAGSFLLDGGHGRYRNHCSDLFAPDGGRLWQDKLRLTGFEMKTGVIASGDALKVFEVDGIRAGISVCYDSEFPLPVRAQCEAGAACCWCPAAPIPRPAPPACASAAWHGRWRTACSWRRR